MIKNIRKNLPAIVLFTTLLLLWEIIVTVANIEPWLLPAPSKIWQAFLRTRLLLPAHLGTTAMEAITGLLLAIAVGVPLAITITVVPFIRRVLLPILVVSQTIPMIVLAPLLVIWLGFGMMPKIVVVALMGFFPIVVSSVDGMDNADREMVNLVSSMGANRFEQLRRVLIPTAIPSFFSGLKIAATYAVVGAVIGEWVGARQGLGIFITRSQSSFRTDQIFVAVIAIAILSILFFATVSILARLSSPWKYIKVTHNEVNINGGRKS